MEKGAGRERKNKQQPQSNIRTCCRHKWVMSCMLVEMGSQGCAGDLLLPSLSRAAIQPRVEAGGKKRAVCHWDVALGLSHPS